MTKIFHPLLALIASATDKELAKYVEYLKYENKLLRARFPKQVHTTAGERSTLLNLDQATLPQDEGQENSKTLADFRGF